MKKISCVLLLILWGLVACSGGSSDSANGDGNNMRTLTLDEPATDTIYMDEAVDVDWYEFNAVEANRTLTVSLTSAYTDSPVDFQLTVYEKDENGNFVTVFGQCAEEDAHAAADLAINVRITQPKRLYFAVRDYKDDDSSDKVQYRISVTYSDEIVTNGTFAEAIAVPVGSAQSCHTEEAIFPRDDTDVYRFDVTTPGVYRIGAQYDLSESTTMTVNLGLELYDASGQIVYQFKGQRPGDYQYVVLANLDTIGTYYLIVNDQGKDDESQYHYSLCIEPVTVDERGENDTDDSPESRDADAEGYNLDGVLEYLQDEDWYALSVPAASGITSQNIRISFHSDFDGPIPEVLTNQFEPDKYRIEVRDAEDNVLHAYDHSVSATAAYNVEIAAGLGTEHKIVVKPLISQQMLIPLPYQLRVQLLEVSDPGEQNDPTLNPDGQTVTGKIYKLGDVDDYSIEVDTASGPKVLEVKFDTDEPSEVAYNVRVMYGDDNYVLKDINGTEDGTHFKASYYLPQTAGGGTTVDLKVSDDQNNDGADVTYTLDVDVLAIPATVTPNTEEAAKASGAVYFDEIDERADATATDVTVIEYDTHGQPDFKANTTLLKVDAVDGSNEWRSDWITGFVDYDGDRDIFKLDFSDITAGQDVWYFKIQVRLFAEGSDVEYGWALFRDRDPVNDKLLERTFWGGQNGDVFEYDESAEGVVAYQCDSDLSAQSFDSTVPANLANPAADELLWLGHVWGASNFYLSLQDFNRALLSKEWNATLERDEGVPNQTPDNDWGNTNSSPTVRPYYFQVAVKYYPQCSHPEHTTDGCVQ